MTQCMRCDQPGELLCESCRQQIDHCILCTAPLIGPARGTLLCGGCHADAAMPPTTIPLMLAALRGEKRLGNAVYIFLGDRGWLPIPWVRPESALAQPRTIAERYPGHVWDERFGIVHEGDPRLAP